MTAEKDTRDHLYLCETKSFRDRQQLMGSNAQDEAASARSKLRSHPGTLDLVRSWFDQLDKVEQIETPYRAVRAAESMLRAICRVALVGGIPPTPTIEQVDHLHIEWQLPTVSISIEVSGTGEVSWWIYKLGQTTPDLDRDMVEGDFVWADTRSSPEFTTAVSAIAETLCGG